jgi:hypothetical protein
MIGLKHRLLNPLTRELNPSKQRCLPGFFTGDFKFNFLVLEKKAYLIDFPSHLMK